VAKGGRGEAVGGWVGSLLKHEKKKKKENTFCPTPASSETVAVNRDVSRNYCYFFFLSHVDGFADAQGKGGYE